jgi:hypothetical protein
LENESRGTFEAMQLHHRENYDASSPATTEAAATVAAEETDPSEEEEDDKEEKTQPEKGQDMGQRAREAKAKKQLGSGEGAAVTPYEDASDELRGGS